MLIVSRSLQLPDNEIEMIAVRAQGAGGQNINKVSSAIHLRFNIHKSSLPDELKLRLLALRDQRVSGEGVIVIKAQQHRTQEANRQDARDRLRHLIASVLHVPAKRIPTRVRRAAVEKRLRNKARTAQKKSLRRHIHED
ncbi:MAG: alternative ribosome rescue aminoacyl-tRNA hydrolase ArfB [Pseudomonadales bacterium]|nr:alternative ribosome rescue aminoacyl-tRNA hydrolase ArfB [Pseudomonadales bacterium]